MCAPPPSTGATTRRASPASPRSRSSRRAPNRCCRSRSIRRAIRAIGRWSIRCSRRSASRRSRRASGRSPRSIIEAMAQTGAAEAVSEFCVPIAITSLAAFTDVPIADSERWVGWITKMFDVSDPVAGAAASRELVAYIDDADRRASRRADRRLPQHADRGRDRRRTARRQPDTLVHDSGVRRRLRDHGRRAFGHAAAGSPNIPRRWHGLQLSRP